MPASQPASQKERRLVIFALAATLPVVALGVLFATRSDEQIANNPRDGAINLRSQTVEIGGVRRPASDVRGRAHRKVSAAASSTPLTPEERLRKRYPYGTTPPLQPDTNRSTELAMEALTAAKGTYPERITALIQPNPFDLRSYQSDPQAYLDVSEPGRIWQTAQPGDGVPVLSALMPTQQTMRQGETIRLKVKSAPNAPVTFTSFDLGRFSNGLTSETVAADAEGVATASFTAPPGTAYNVNLLVGSPLATGQTKFRIFIIPPSSN